MKKTILAIAFATSALFAQTYDPPYDPSVPYCRMSSAGLYCIDGTTMKPATPEQLKIFMENGGNITPEIYDALVRASLNNATTGLTPAEAAKTQTAVNTASGNSAERTTVFINARTPGGK